MPKKPSEQLVAAAKLIAIEAKQQRDYRASNVAWALANQMQFGRPMVWQALAALPPSQIRSLVANLKQHGSNLGTAWLAVRDWCAAA